MGSLTWSVLRDFASAAGSSSRLNVAQITTLWYLFLLNPVVLFNAAYWLLLHSSRVEHRAIWLGDLHLPCPDVTLHVV